MTKHLVKTHLFSWPSGHSRFRYTKDNTTGLFRLQTIRFESLDIQQQVQGASAAVSGRQEVDPLSVSTQDTDWETGPASVQSCPPGGQLLVMSSYCDQFGPLSVQSCPELQSSAQMYQDAGPWSVQASGQHAEDEFKELYQEAAGPWSLYAEIKQQEDH